MKKPLTKLMKHQLDALRWSDNVTHPAFFITMRGRKCLLTIRRIKRWKSKGPILILCPEAAIDGWLYWLKKDRIKNVTELVGSGKQRLELLNKDIYGWYISNKECHRSTPEIRDVPWDVLVFDESRYIANPTSKMSKFHVNNFRDVNHRIALTGTPDYKQKMDFYQQLRFLDHKSLPYRDFWEFRMKAFFQSGYDFIIKKKHNDILTKSLNKYAYFIGRDDIKGGRTKEYIQYTLKLPRKLRKKYDVIEKEFVFEDQDMKTIFATQSHIWMMRLCGGFIDDEMIWDGKYQFIKELLNTDLNDEKVVIFCRFKFEVYSITKKFIEDKFLFISYTGDYSKERRSEKRSTFNKNKNIRGMVAHPAAISHGTDLSSATVVIFYSQPPGEEIRDQSEERIMTYADEKHMLIIDILTKDTVDQDAREGHLEGDSRRKIFERAVKRWQ